MKCSDCIYLRQNIKNFDIRPVLPKQGDHVSPCNRYPQNTYRGPGEPACGEFKRKGLCGGMEKWSRSNTEEAIGILWLILTVLLKQCGSEHWWKATLALGLMCQVASICFVVQRRYKESLEKRIARRGLPGSKDAKG